MRNPPKNKRQTSLCDPGRTPATEGLSVSSPRAAGYTDSATVRPEALRALCFAKGMRILTISNAANPTATKFTPAMWPTSYTKPTCFHMSAFATAASLPGRRAPHTRAQSPQHLPRPRSASRRRRRLNPVTAVFIWSNDYEDESDESEDPDVDAESDAVEEQPAWDGMRRTRAEVSLGDAGLGDAFGSFAPSSSLPDPRNPLYTALRTHTTGPDDVDRLRAFASDSAADAFRRIVVGILGTIPTDTYEVVVSSDRGGVSRLMQSSLSTGYALRNAEFRMALNDCMTGSGPRESASLADSPGSGVTGQKNTTGTTTVHDLFTSEPDYMNNVPRRGNVDARGVSGVVRWWDSEREAKQEMKGADYVAKLEAENELLRERLAATQLHDANNNKLMDFMRTLNPEKIAALQTDLSRDAVDAFKRVIKSVLGELNGSKVQMTYSTSRDYLAQLTFWCLLAGYCIRNLEKRLEMSKLFKDMETVAEPSLRDAES